MLDGSKNGFRGVNEVNENKEKKFSCVLLVVVKRSFLARFVHKSTGFFSEMEMKNRNRYIYICVYILST